MAKDRVMYVEYIRTLGILCIVTIHITSGNVHDLSLIGTNRWWGADFFYTLSKWSVPPFFMVTGMFLLNNRNESMRDFYVRKFTKIMIPLITSLLLYEVYKYGFPGLLMWKVINEIFTDNVWYHFWFMYALVGIYLVAPFLSKFVNALGKRELQVLLVIAFLYNSVYLPFSVYFNYQQSLSVSVIGGYVMYVILGYYLNKYPLTKPIRITSYSLAIASVILTFFGTYWINKGQGYFNEYFYDYLNFTTFFISTGVFTFFSQVKSRSKMLNKAVLVVGANSFGIYLVHPLMIQLFWLANWKFNLGVRSVYVHNTPILVLIVFLASFAATYIIRTVYVLLLISTIKKIPLRASIR